MRKAEVYALIIADMATKVQTSRQIGAATPRSQGSLKPRPAVRRSQVARIARQIEKAILSGRIAPGERLNEISLAQSLGASRTPVREAIRLLVAQGLLVSQLGRGASVPKLDAARITELLDVRSHLECFALELAIPRISAAELQSLKNILNQMDMACHEMKWQVYENKDDEFHVAILNASKNETLKSVINGLSKQIRIARSTILSIPGELDAAQEFHRALFDRIADKDIERALVLRRKALEDDKVKLLKIFEMNAEHGLPCGAFETKDSKI